MNKTKKILISKMQLLLLAVAILLCGACSLDDKFNADVETTPDVQITNEIEVTIKALSIIYDKVESITESISRGQSIDIEINSAGDKWSYSCNNAAELLSGKITVDITENPTTKAKIKTIDCSKLKIRYYKDVWLRLFGTIIVEDIDVNSEYATRKITTTYFGYNNDMIMLPKITINSDYVVVSYVNSRHNYLVNILSRGSSSGDSKSLGSYRQTVTSTIRIDATTYNIVDGKMLIYVEKLNKEIPIEVEYSAEGRTVNYGDNAQRTYYSESNKK
jgi:hypothetical protein